MNHIPFPLISPINEQEQVYHGYITINDIEYYIKIQLGHNCDLNGDKKFLKLFNEHKQQNLIKVKLQQATDVMVFLTEFKEILETSQNSLKPFQYSFKYYTFIYDELCKIGFDKIQEITQDMTVILFKTIDDHKRLHLLRVELSFNYPITAPKAHYDLPSHLDIGTNLSILVSEFEKSVNKYQGLFNCFDELDQHMRVLEPENPKRSDCWRRIALGYHCTLELELNPDALDKKPNKINFYGNVNRVNELKSKWNGYQWNKKLKVHENLLHIFQSSENSTEDYLNTGDIECGICYSYKLNDTNIPDIICSCNRAFHHQCLYEWLRGNPSTTQSFNILFGKCPYCNEKIAIHAKLS